MGTEQRRRAAEEFVQLVREALPGRLRAAWLFGSVARGDDNPESDVDVFLVFDQRDEAAVRRVYGIAEEVSVERDVDLSLRILDESEFGSRQANALVRNVQSEGVALA